jgi:hypothetical protein
MSFSMLNFSIAWEAVSIASCCMSSDCAQGEGGERWQGAESGRVPVKNVEGPQGSRLRAKGAAGGCSWAAQEDTLLTLLTMSAFFTTAFLSAISEVFLAAKRDR